MQVFALIPAAGQSRRMGRPKLALPLGDRTVLEHVVAAVHNGGVPDVVVVIGPGTVFLQPLAERAGARVHLLPADTPDMRATMQAGLAWLEQHFHPCDDDAWLLLPADHPTLRADVVQALVAAAREPSRYSIFVPTHQGKRGHPTLLRWKHVAALSALPNGLGLNAFIRSLPAETLEIPWKSADVLCDLDTPEDYERLARAQAAKV
jgi:molybdenum cofactor cytidylyltransferase